MDLLQALEVEGDSALEQLRFKRRKRSLEYVRKEDGAIHKIAFVADFFPGYQADAEAHLHPMMRVEMPDVSERALELVDGNRVLLADAPEVIVNQPIELAAPKGEHARWFAAGDREFGDRVREIVAFLRKWTIPLLDELTTPESLVDAYERREERLLRLRHWHLFVAAALELMGRSGRARRVLEDQLGAPGLRRRYAAAFQKYRG